MNALYRARQFVRLLLGAQPPDLGDLGALLTPPQSALFTRMAAVDQQHCVAVARALVAQGHTEPSLVQAALMHDVGKSVTHIALWERVAHVLLAHVAPRLVGRIGSARKSGFGHGLYVLARQNDLGADLAAQAGFAPDAVALVRGAGDGRLQAALRRADDTH